MEGILKKTFIKYRESVFFRKGQEFYNWLSFFSKTLIDFPYIFKYPGETFKQVYVLGNQALPLVIFSTIFVSMALSLEWATELAPFGAKTAMGSILTVAIIREIGPIVVGLIMAGRTGARVASEIGNMVLTEQIDALRAFGTDPIKRLIVPRVFASLLVMTPLTIVADVMGIISGWFAVVLWRGVNPQFFWLAARDVLFVGDLLVGVIKPIFYGLLIGINSTYLGYSTQGGAEELGQATTKTVVANSIGILILDFLLTKILLAVIGVRH
ncbi:MAG: ABC transporter permease [Calditrichia bacterium]